MFKLGRNSERNMQGVDEILILITRRAITITKSDFGVLNTGGYRSAEMQAQIYKDKHSKCDGYIKRSYHQTGKAIDLVPYVNGRFTWSDKTALFNVYEAFVEAERQLREEWIIPANVFIHHGILWRWKDLNKNGIFDIDDRLGWDACHHEMRNTKQRF